MRIHKNNRSILHNLREFIQLEASSGIILLVSTMSAIALANSPWQNLYHNIINLPLGLNLNNIICSKPALFWVNDGLMAIFFFLVGLEIKREMLEGELNSMQRASLPAIAAMGGMLGPALIYWLINNHNHALMSGWAIPTATDIAFSLGVLMLLGKRVPPSLKIFLTALAIFDDLGAIIIIALYYTHEILWAGIASSAICFLLLTIINYCQVTRLAPYLILGFFLWLSMLHSGIHATISGVLLAITVPLRSKSATNHSPLRSLEHSLHPWVAYGVLPIFGFFNAGVSFANLHLIDILNPLSLGIMLGLFLGKQLGILSASYVAIKFNVAKMPPQANWPRLYGIALLCGIGFTMSLFIGTLAFIGPDYSALIRLGVIGGSLLSGLVGYFWLRIIL